MFCRKCGAELNDEAVVCVKCGCSTEEKPAQPIQQVHTEVDEPKTGIGILMGLFMGIIGLIIGLCLFREGTVARKTFIKAWGITFGICIAVVVLFYVIIFSAAMSTTVY